MLEFDLLIDCPLPEEGGARGLFSSFDLPRVSLVRRQVRDKHGGVINLYFDLFYALI